MTKNALRQLKRKDVMARKIALFGGILLCAVYLCGCVALVAGAAGGVGTATWLSGKLTQQVPYSFEKSISACRSALKALDLPITKETVTEDVAQIMGMYTDGKTIWIDVHRVSAQASRIDIRVGATGNKQAARQILDKILKVL
jgi:hypothetical protein